jgi:hypothetical protein
MLILFQTVRQAGSVPYVRLATLHLMDPLTAVHALYGPVDPVLAWQEHALGRFIPEGERDRLCVGPVSSNDSGAFPGGRGYTFGVTRGLEGSPR